MEYPKYLTGNHKMYLEI